MACLWGNLWADPSPPSGESFGAEFRAEGILERVLLRINDSFDSGGGVVGDDFLGASAEGGGADEAGNDAFDL